MCAVLCCAVLCCAVLYRAGLCCAVPCRAGLCRAVLCCALPGYAVLCRAVLCCAGLSCAVPCCVCYAVPCSVCCAVPYFAVPCCATNLSVCSCIFLNTPNTQIFPFSGMILATTWEYGGTVFCCYCAENDSGVGSCACHLHCLGKFAYHDVALRFGLLIKLFSCSSFDAWFFWIVSDTWLEYR